jgi:hypothetical protein
MKSSIFVSILMCLIACFATAGELSCVKDAKIIIPIDSVKFRVEVASYCYSEEPLKVISSNCYKQSCEALALKILPDKMEHNRFGTPGSHVCHRFGGIAQIVFYEIKGTKLKFDRCLFSSDHSFADLGTFWAAKTRPPEIKILNSKAK